MKMFSRSIFCPLIMLTLLCSPSYLKADSKAQIAIKDITVDSSISNSAKQRLNTNIIYKELEAAIQGTKKFSLITRDKTLLKSTREEQQFSKSDATAGDAAYNGQLKNVDYLFFPEIISFSFYRTLNDVPNLPGKYKRSDHGTIKLDIRVLDTTTGEIVKVFTNRASFATASELTSEKSKSPAPGNFEKLAKSIAAKSADDIIAHLYPMKVVKVNGKKIWINRGDDGGLTKGLVLNIYTPGEALVDPDTGDILGSAEEYIGQVKVERVNPKYSIAILVKNTDSEMVSQGHILRKPN